MQGKRCAVIVLSWKIGGRTICSVLGSSSLPGESRANEAKVTPDVTRSGAVLVAVAEGDDAAYHLDCFAICIRSVRVPAE